MGEPLYRVTFDAALLARENPPKFHHPHKSALYELAYPGGIVPPGLIAVTHWAARVDHLVIHAGNEAGTEDATCGLGVAETVAAQCGNPCSLDKLVSRCARLGYQWGESDGN
jgi:hypothetical protein